MPIFKKEDVLDLTQLQKRGLLKEKPQEKLKKSDEYISLSPLNIEPTAQAIEQPQQNFFNFLDSPQQTESQKINSEQQNSDLLIKLENLEYQFERLTEKLSTMEEKIRSFEEKVNKEQNGFQ